jgi:mRNA interferase MazF
VKGYPFEIALPEGLPLSGVVLSDHLKSADWRERRAEYVGRVDMSVMIEIRARLSPLLGFS